MHFRICCCGSRICEKPTKPSIGESCPAGELPCTPRLRHRPQASEKALGWKAESSSRWELAQSQRELEAAQAAAGTECWVRPGVVTRTFPRLTSAHGMSHVHIPPRPASQGPQGCPAFLAIRTHTGPSLSPLITRPRWFRETPMPSRVKSPLPGNTLAGWPGRAPRLTSRITRIFVL